MKKYILTLVITLAHLAGRSQTITLATYQYADNNRISNIEPLARHLEKKCGITVKVKSYPTVHSFIAGIQNNEADIALINTFGYLLLEASGKQYNMKPSFALEVRKGAKDNYKTAIVAAKKVNADTITGLKPVASSLRLLLVNIGSTSGNLVPRLALNAAGIDMPEQEFASVAYGKTHKATLDSVLQDKADVCAVGSSEYFSLLSDTSKSNNIKLLWLSPEIPLGPVLIHNRLKPGLQASISSVFKNLHLDNPAALTAVKNGWSEAAQADKFVEINGDHYQRFAEAFGTRSSMQRILEQFVFN